MNFFIASEVRSGSTAIAEYIAYSLEQSFGIQVFDLTKEHFSEVDEFASVEKVSEVFDQLWVNEVGAKTSKLLAGQIAHVERITRPYPEVNQKLFGNGTFWLIVRRRDKVKQAVSLALARLTGRYHEYEETGEAAPDIADADLNMQILEALRAINLSDLFLSNFFDGKSNTATVYYEDFLGDPRAGLESFLQRLDWGLELRSLEVAYPKLVRTHGDRKETARGAFLEFFKTYF